MSILERVKAALPALPPAEQRVAKLLLADARSFASLPVSELADRSHVSKPTVVRFCRSVGYDGLADFKLKLAGSVNEGVPFVHRAVDEDDKPLKYQIVGQAESDAKVGRVSYESPLARALIGKSVGDEVEVTVPSGEKFYLIDKIEFL